MCSTASAAVEAVAGVAADLGGEILALMELREALDAALVDRVRRFDATEGYADDGAYSFACWLRARVDVTRAESLQLGRFARTLATMPHTQAAVAAGKLSVTKARLLAGVINPRTREQFDDHEPLLVDHVQALDVDAAKIVLAHWKRLADTDGPDPGDPTRNRASITEGWDGRVHIDIDLDPVSGALVKAALDAIVDRMHSDGKFTDRTDDSVARRRADGFVEMAHRSTGKNPDQPTLHPDVIVLIPFDRLHQPDDDPFGPQCELIGTGPITLADALRLALLGTVSPLHLDEDGRPLKLGRKQRLASHDQRIVLDIFDRGCVIPGCDRPAAYCQAHHQLFWDRDNGPTDIDRLALTCSHHHHLIHDKHWTIHRTPDGTWHLTRPNGTQVDPPRYPNRHQARARPPG